MATELIDLLNYYTFDSLILPLAVEVESVTRPGEAAIVDIAGVWLLSTMPDAPPGATFSRSTTRRILSLRRSDVPTAPIRTVVICPERPGQPNKRWEIDGIEQEDPDVYECVMTERGTP